MGGVGAKSRPALGFLTVLEHADHGLFGGYLVLNTSGRPLEFHCTAPIRANRAQQILYGPTLEPFLYGEQIGQTLLGKAKVAPIFVCTDREPVLAVREHTAVPVAMVLPGESPTDDYPAGGGADRGDFHRVDTAHGGENGNLPASSTGPHLLAFDLGRNRLALPEGAEADRNVIAERFGELAESFDLAEPFARIREAIEEAQKAV